MSKVDLLEWTSLADFNAAILVAEEKARKAARSIYTTYQRRGCSGSFVRSTNHAVASLQTLKHRVNSAAERFLASTRRVSVPALYAGDPCLYSTYSAISNDDIWWADAEVTLDGEPVRVMSVDTEYEQCRGRWVSRALVARRVNDELQFRWLSVYDKPPFKLP